MKDPMAKMQKSGSASARAFKAEALDLLVKKEQENKRAALNSKIARLKALRLARDAAEEASAAPAAPKAKSGAAKK